MREQKTKEYLTAIYVLASDGPVRGAYVARELKLSRPTVSVALRTLEEEGYLSIDREHLVHLTASGEQLAREAMHETVRRSRSYHELVGHTEEEGESENSVFTRRPSQEVLLQRLEKEHAEAIPEAILILSERYYCVRVIDIAQFLGRSSAAVRSKLRLLEHMGIAVVGDESVVRLTESGREIAEQLHTRHAREREELILQGAHPEAEERRVLQQ